MVRIRAYSLVLSLPLLIALSGLIWFWVADVGRDVVGLLIFLVGAALQLFLGLTIACPRCGKSPYVIGPHWGALGFAGQPVPDVICSKCGHDFRSSNDPKVG